MYAGHTQGSTIVATAGSILSSNLMTIFNVRNQHHKLEHMVYVFSQRSLPLIRIPIGHTESSTKLLPWDLH